MHEDEFYRALQKKIRAEEMLKASSLPPSMAKREKNQQKQSICPRTLKELETEDDEGIYKVLRKTRKKNRISLEKEFEELQRDFIDGQKRKEKVQLDI